MQLGVPYASYPAPMALLDPTAALVPQTDSLMCFGSHWVYLVSNAHQLLGALTAVRAVLEGDREPTVAVDLEWRAHGQSTVALLQLAHPPVCVLVRTCHVPFRPTLQAFLRDPILTIVGFNWDSNDEKKMRQGFNFGRAQFARFADLAVLAESLGYYNHGVAKLSRSVLQIPQDKNRDLATSDWEAEQLSPAQITYAACDVLTTFLVYKQLRQWQQAGWQAPTCQQCLQRLGQVLRPRLRCMTCTLCCPTIGQLLGHGMKARHDTGFRQCESCGRVYMVEPPASQQQQGLGLPHESAEEALLREQQETAAGVRFG